MSLRYSVASATQSPPMNTDIMGLSGYLLDRSTTCLAVVSASVIACGVKSTSRLWTLGSRSADSTATAYLSGRASPRMSMGFPVDAASGRLPSSFSTVSSESDAIFRPSFSTRSVDSIPGPPALVTMAIPSSSGRLCWVKATA